MHAQLHFTWMVPNQRLAAVQQVSSGKCKCNLERSGENIPLDPIARLAAIQQGSSLTAHMHTATMHVYDALHSHCEILQQLCLHFTLALFCPLFSSVWGPIMQLCRGCFPMGRQCFGGEEPAQWFAIKAFRNCAWLSHSNEAAGMKGNKGEEGRGKKKKKCSRHIDDGAA